MTRICKADALRLVLATLVSCAPCLVTVFEVICEYIYMHMYIYIHVYVCLHLCECMHLTEMDTILSLVHSTFVVKRSNLGSRIQSKLEIRAFVHLQLFRPPLACKNIAPEMPLRRWYNNGTKHCPGGELQMKKLTLLSNKTSNA